MNKVALVMSLIGLIPTVGKAKPQHRQVVVAIIDTGIDSKNPRFKKALETEKGRGWNFAANNSDTSDMHGHGTHIAGIVLDLAPEVKILPLKYYDPTKTDLTSTGSLSSTVQAIKYAVQMKVDIINYSGGGSGKDPEEEKALKEAEAAGILVVAAAGNDGRNTDQAGFYPASYHLKNMISVASLDEKQKILASSNFGTSTVDIAAPGKNIISDVPGGIKATMTGTSQATAIVTGTAALILSSGRLPVEILKKRILSAVDTQADLQKKTHEGGKLNIERSLKLMSRTQTALGDNFEQTEISQGNFTYEKIASLATKIEIP